MRSRAKGIAESQDIGRGTLWPHAREVIATRRQCSGAPPDRPSGWPPSRRPRRLRACGHMLCQDPAVLDRHDCALGDVLQGRVGRVAEQGDVAVDPGQQWVTVEPTRIQWRLGSADSVISVVLFCW